MRSLVCLLFMILTVLPAFAQNPDPDWTACQTDDDCSIMTGMCNYDWAINKEFFDQAKKIVQGEQICDKTGSHNPNAVTACLNHVCTIVTKGMRQ